MSGLELGREKGMEVFKAKGFSLLGRKKDSPFCMNHQMTSFDPKVVT